MNSQPKKGWMMYRYRETLNNLWQKLKVLTLGEQ
jgi:hypothetical protein